MSRTEPYSEELPKTEAEWNERCIAFLNDIGVRNPKVGESGSIPVSPNPGKVRKTSSIEDTSTRQAILNQLPREPNERALVGGPQVLGDYGNPVCNLLSCRLLSKLPRTCSRMKTNWIDPDINSNALPNEVPSATVYLNPFNARIEGDVEFKMGNHSQPGKKITQKIYKCQQNGPKQEDTKPQSAVLDGNNDGAWKDRDVGEKIDDVSHSWSQVDYGSSATATMSFKKKGALNVVETLFNAWSQGYMEARAETELKVTYKWRGNKKTKTFNTTNNVRIPVTNLSYSW